MRFEIDINWHPEYNTKEDWRQYNFLEDYMREFSVGIDELNDLIENNALRILDEPLISDGGDTKIRKEHFECHWEKSEKCVDGQYYKTSCQNNFYCFRGGLKKDKIQFCPYCSKVIVED